MFTRYSAALGVMLLLGQTASVYAQTSVTGRHADVYQKRVELQNNMREWLEKALNRVAYPYDILVTVRLRVRGDVREVVRKESQPGSEIKLGAKKAVKLPGLAMVDLPTGGPDAPEAVIRIPSHESVEVSQEIDAMVEQISIKLLVEEGIPEDRLEQVKTVAIEIGGLDLGRGDTLDVDVIPPRTVSKANIHPVMMARQSVWIACLTVLLCAVILAWAIARARKPDTRMSGEFATSGNAGIGALVDGEGLEVIGDEPEDDEVMAASGTSSGPRAFGFLGEVPRDQLVELLTLVKPRTAAIVLDQVSLKPEAMQALFQQLPNDKQLGLVKALGTPEVLQMSQIAEMEDEARGVLKDVRSRMAVGSTRKAATLLAEAPDSALREILDRLAEDNPELGAEVRKRLVLFEDLTDMPIDFIRQVVANTDPTVTALALHGTQNGIRDAIMGAISKRLQGILTAEADAMKDPPTEKIEAARRTVETTMRRIRRGVRSGGATA